MLRTGVTVMDHKLIVSTSPHIRTDDSTQKIMLRVIIALLPVTVYAVVVFGTSAVYVLAACIAGAMLGELVMQAGRRMPITLTDLSALLTGLLLALTLPAHLPWWIALIAGFTATILAKQMFGGLGHNIFNPALVGRAVIFVSWASYMTSNYVKSASIGIANTATHKAIERAVDVVNGATPLAAMKIVYDPVGANVVPQGLQASNYYKPLLFANPWGCMGEVSALLLILGGIYLIATRVIDWKIPVTYIGTVAVLTAISGRDPLFYTLAGGLLLGAIYMATDYTTSPLSGKGKVIFGLGLGLTTFLLRFWSNSPEAVMFSILFMNAIVPMIDRFVLPRTYGRVSEKEEAMET
jgi:electron transport complex protein RnfD